MEVKARLDFSGLSLAGIRFLQGVVQGLHQPGSGGGAKGSAEPPVMQAEEDGAAPSDRTQPEAEVQRI